ncbi:MAG: xanthine dehydrogenase family protein subunit M [Syntrophobacteraceae bacterium]|nr:xanthine dehydrogenase family protein subunit M [Syntrophobacteraceae bacterium]
MKDFDFVRPKTLDDAVSLYKMAGQKASLLAGGTELINQIRSGKAQPDLVIDLKHIRDLDFLSMTPEGIRIGALYRTRDAELCGPLRDSRYNALSYASGTLGSPQVRNKATIVGNVCRASPSGDLIPPLIALGARAKIVGPGTSRSVTVEEVIVGPNRTILHPGEVVSELEISRMEDCTGCSYSKLSPRKSLDLAIVGVAVLLRTDPDSRCLDAKIVVGAVAPTAVRAKKAESILIGSKFTEATIEECSRAAAEVSRARDTSIRASAWYRKKMVEALVKRTIGLALEQIKEGKKRGRLWNV